MQRSIFGGKRWLINHVLEAERVHVKHKLFILWGSFSKISPVFLWLQLIQTDRRTAGYGKLIIEELALCFVSECLCELVQVRRRERREGKLGQQLNAES